MNWKISIVKNLKIKKVFAFLSLLILFINLVPEAAAIYPVEDVPALAEREEITVRQQIEEWARLAIAEANRLLHSAGTWISAGIDVWKQSDFIIAKATYQAWMFLRKMLLNMLVNDIVKWIQGGGKPRFVTDWQGFLKTAADKAGGQFITDYLKMGALCKPIKVTLDVLLPRVPVFDESVKCTLSDVVKNIEDFYNDFSRGGWKSWIKISEPANNIYGAYLTALDQKWGVESAAADSAKNEAVSGQGFLGDKICREIDEGGQITYSDTDGWKEDEIPEGAKCTKWETRTPGKIAGDAISQAVNIDIPELISAKEFAEYASAIVNAAINRVAREGIAHLTAGSEGTSYTYNPTTKQYNYRTGSGISTPASVSVNLSSYEDANQNGAVAKTLTDQQKLYKENLEKLLASYQASLAVLNNTKTSQYNILAFYRDLLQNNCPLPADVSQTSTSTQKTTTCTNVSIFNSGCPCTATEIERIKTVKPGIGEAILEKTTVQTYDFGTEGSGCGLTNTTVTYQTISTASVVENEITAVNTEMSTLQNKITQTNTAYIDTAAYQKSAADYMTIYEVWQRGDKNAATSTAETAMKTAKQKAVASNQTLFGSTSTNFNEFTQQTTESSTETVQKNSDTQTKKGFTSNCSYTRDGSLSQQLCSAQSIERNYKTSLDACIASQASIGG